MSGFGSIGEWAIGEDETDGAWVQVGVVEAEASTYPSSFVSGGVSPGTVEASADSFSPIAAAGASVEPTAENAEAVAEPPISAAGARISAAEIDAEAASLGPSSFAGVNVSPATCIAAAQAETPQVTSGARSSIGSLSAMAETFGSETFSAGVVISPVSVLIFDAVSGGGIGDGATGEFAIGEGPEESQTISREMRARATVFEPRVVSGASILPPVDPASAELFNPEIDTRFRNARLYAIAS